MLDNAPPNKTVHAHNQPHCKGSLCADVDPSPCMMVNLVLFVKNTAQHSCCRVLSESKPTCTYSCLIPCPHVWRREEKVYKRPSCLSIAGLFLSSWFPYIKILRENTILHFLQPTKQFSHAFPRICPHGTRCGGGRSRLLRGPSRL